MPTNLQGMMGALVIFDDASVRGPSIRGRAKVEGPTSNQTSPDLPADWMQKIAAPPGMTIQWVRSHLMGELDLPNIQKRLDNGWAFVNPEDYPDYPAAPIEKAIETGGLILMQKETDRVEYDLAVGRQEQVDRDHRLGAILANARTQIAEDMAFRGFTKWDIELWFGRHWK